MKTKSVINRQSPALSFISGVPAQEEEPAAEQPVRAENAAPTAPAAPAGYKPNPEYIETKSKRVQLLMQPSLYEGIKSAATAQGLSVNEFIHKTLEKAVKGE